MGYRSTRFAMLIEKNKIKFLKIEKKGEFKVSSAENILLEIKT